MTGAPASSGPVLRDIHVPQVSWWPPALGWWLLAMALLVSIVAIAVMVPHYRRRRRPLLAARRELDALAACHARDSDAAALATGVSRLLRRIALAINPAAAASAGAAWRVFLDSRASGVFTCEQLGLLTDAQYRAHPSLDASALLAAAREWCVRVLRTRDATRGSCFLRRDRVAAAR